jgi:peptide/nickel transport system ATP-binding protein
VLAAEGVSRQYGHGARRFTAVHPTDLTVGPGRRLGIVGESGSGKSTLARILVGLETPSTGEVTFRGELVRRLLSTRTGREDFRRSVQMVVQDTSSSFDPRRPLIDSLRQPLAVLRGITGSEADDRAADTARRLHLDPALLRRFPAEVSGGQRQRFSLARALVVQPQVLVCDEVVSALDVSVQGTVLNSLKEVCETSGAGLVFVSHGLPATAFVADEVIVMASGRIVESGPSLTVLSSPEHEVTRAIVSAYEPVAS